MNTANNPYFKIRIQNTEFWSTSENGEPPVDDTHGYVHKSLLSAVTAAFDFLRDAADADMSYSVDDIEIVTFGSADGATTGAKRKFVPVSCSTLGEVILTGMSVSLEMQQRQIAASNKLTALVRVLGESIEEGDPQEIANNWLSVERLLPKPGQELASENTKILAMSDLTETRLRHKLDRLSKERGGLKAKFDGRESEGTFHGGYHLGYVEGQIAALENNFNFDFDVVTPTESAKSDADGPDEARRPAPRMR